MSANNHRVTLAVAQPANDIGRCATLDALFCQEVPFTPGKDKQFLETRSALRIALRNSLHPLQDRGFFSGRKLYLLRPTCRAQDGTSDDDHQTRPTHGQLILHGREGVLLPVKFHGRAQAARNASRFSALSMYAQGTSGSWVKIVSHCSGMARA